MTKLVVLTPPRPPYLLFDTRRLDASNSFIPVKENAEIAFSCVSEGGNPKPLITWEILLNPSVDHHALKLPPDSLEVQVMKPKDGKSEKDYKINSGAKSDAKLPVVYRAHHNARVLCVMEHPSLKIRQNASIVLDVQCEEHLIDFYSFNFKNFIFRYSILCNNENAWIWLSTSRRHSSVAEV